MNFRRKLIIAFSIVVVLPVVIHIIAFFIIGNLPVAGRPVGPGGEFILDYNTLSQNVARRGWLVLIIVLIFALAITALLLTRWLWSSLVKPIRDLDVAMNAIRDGNLDYRLATTEQGEIAELYRNYEDMRLRLKESADEKLEKEKQLRELISNISHDLKTPMTAIKGYAEGLIDGVANTPEKQEKYIRTIYNKANDMDKLINELTLYSRIDSERIPYNFHRINVAEYFGDCIEEIGMDLESRGIQLNYANLVSQDTVIIADPEQLKRVINNIVSNSVKYMDKNRGRIDIRILDEQDSIRVEIEDNGKGIAARDLPNIFDRFYRTDSSRSSATGGSGIGLSIVKKIVEDHGGYIWATSREGEGTCMHFVFRKYREKTDEDVVEMEMSGDAEATAEPKTAGAAAKERRSATARAGRDGRIRKDQKKGIRK